ncbi:MAG: PAS domain-containing protein, partial [Fidelibacterota bacterium]
MSTGEAGDINLLLEEGIKPEDVLFNLGDGVSVQNREFRIIYQNSILKDLFGDHKGEYCYKIYERRDENCEECPVEKALKTGRPHISLRVGVKQNGETSYWENCATPIKDGKGNIIAAVEVTRNVADRVKLEEDVRKRTHELAQANKELKKLKDLLEKKVEDIDRDLRDSEAKYRKKFEEIRLLYDINSALIEGETTEKVVKAIAEKIKSHLNLEFVAIAFLSDDKNYIEYKYVTIESEMIKRVEKFGWTFFSGDRVNLFEGSKLRNVIEDTNVVKIRGKEEIKEHIRSHSNKKGFKRMAGIIAGMTGFKYGSIIPISSGTGVLGILGVASRESEISDDDIEKINIITNQFGIWLERIKLQEKIAEAEARYRDLYDNAPVMYHSLDPEGHFIECNQTEADMLGYKKEEIVGRHIKEFLTEESRKI